MVELALIATRKPDFEICYGVSDNKYRWVDIDHTRDVLGYLPKDSHEKMHTAVTGTGAKR